MAPETAALIFAIDAGGTATQALLGNLRGETFALVEGPAFNARQMDRDRFRRLIVQLYRDGVNQADLYGKLPDIIAAGVAGAGGEEVQARLKGVIERRWPRCTVLVQHDAFIAHYGAFEGRPGVMVTAGTGSIAYGRNAEGAEARAGGWGWMLGDEGSAWWIGREALRAVLAAEGGAGPETRLTELVMDHFRLEEIMDLLDEVYQPRFDRGKITVLAPEVTRLAEEGDRVAADLLRSAGRELGTLAVRAASALRIPADTLEVALQGGVVEGAGEWIRGGVIEVLESYRIEGESGGGEPGEVEAEHPADAGSAGTGETGGEERESAAPDTIPDMPQFPLKHLRPIPERGPRLVKPCEDAVHGAARWARDHLLRSRFA